MHLLPFLYPNGMFDNVLLSFTFGQCALKKDRPLVHILGVAKFFFYYSAHFSCFEVKSHM